MALRSGKPKELNIDPEQIFYLWVRLGTLARTAEYLAQQGVYNSRNGKPISGSSVHSVATDFILNNPEKAREEFIKQDPIYANDVTWELGLLNRAIPHYSTNRLKFLMWALDHDIYYKYFDRFKIRWNLVEGDKELSKDQLISKYKSSRLRTR